MARRKLLGRTAKPCRSSSPDQLLDAVVRDVEHDGLLVGGGADTPAPVLLGQVGEGPQRGARRPPGAQGHPDREAAVALPCDPHMVARVGFGRRGRRTVRQGFLEVFRLEDLPEPLRPPVPDEELQPGPVAAAPVAVVAEQRGDPGPGVGDQVRLDEPAQPLPQHAAPSTGRRRPTGRSRAPSSGCVHADERDVVDLVQGALVGTAGHRALELAGQVGEVRVADVALDGLLQDGGRVDDLVGRDPASGQPRTTRGTSPHASVLDSPTASSRLQISGTSSIRIQCSWTFCRSVMSATSRPNVCAISATVRSCGWSAGRRPSALAA